MAKAMQLRPSQIRDKTIKRFKKVRSSQLLPANSDCQSIQCATDLMHCKVHWLMQQCLQLLMHYIESQVAIVQAPNPYMKRQFHRPYSFSSSAAPAAAAMPYSIKSYIVADQQSEIDPETLRGTGPQQNSGEHAPLSKQNSGQSIASNMSARQRQASVRLSAGLSAVEPRRTTGQSVLGADAALATGADVRESGRYSMPRPSSYGRLNSANMQTSTRRRTARSTNDDVVTSPPTLPAAEMAPLPEHNTASAVALQQSNVTDTRALTAESVHGTRKTNESDKPIATLGPESEQVSPPSCLPTRHSRRSNSTRAASKIVRWRCCVACIARAM